MKELVILGGSLSALARIDIHENETDEELLQAHCRLGDNDRNCLIATSDDWLKFIVNSRAAIDQALS